MNEVAARNGGESKQKPGVETTGSLVIAAAKYGWPGQRPGGEAAGELREK
ncbi:hypothetical protein [Calycomorphotria hydatis]|nr:hypothetical protein [Calycomorphotria hydatis]